MRFYKKMDLSDVLSIPHQLQINIYNYKTFENLYYDYLNNRGVKLYYQKKDLLKYIDENIKYLDNYDAEEHIKKIEKQASFDTLKRGIFGASVFFFMYVAHVAAKDYVIHEEANTKNSYALASELTVELDKNNIPLTSTEVLEYIDSYYKPTDDPYYKHSNAPYYLLDKTRVIDNVSMIIALDKLNQDLIQIDDEIYSKSGQVTQIEINTINGNKYTYNTSKTYSNYSIDNKELMNVLINKYGKDIIKNIEYKGTYSVKRFEELPTIYKSKKDGHIEVKKSNKTLGKLANSYIKSN